MLERTRHYRTATKAELTPRQCEVLGLIAGGKTNPEIAEALGITLDGAKFHVREILGKLEVESREEAAAWWRGQRSVGSRISSAARALLPATWLKPAIAGTALGGLALTSVVVVLALNGGGTGGEGLALPACNADEFTWSIELAPAQVNPGGIDYALFASNATACQLDGVIGVAGYGATLDALGGAFMLGLGNPVAVTIEKQRVSPEPAALIVGTVINVCSSATGLMVVITTPEQSSFYAPTAMPTCEDPPRGAGFSALWSANWKAMIGQSGAPPWWERIPTATPSH
jgi:DNA-binding CsgD family transcriptional regulator